MEARRHRRAGRAWRVPLRSPGRPPVGRREHRERFWERIARGQSSEDAGVAAGVSAAVGTRWFRESGGVSHVISPLSARYLSFVEREEIALCFARGLGVREIATRLGRSPLVSRAVGRRAIWDPCQSEPLVLAEPFAWPLPCPLLMIQPMPGLRPSVWAI
jgi:hypothetical protein